MPRPIEQTDVDRTQLRRIIAELSDGIVIYEMDGTLSWANRKALAMHGGVALDALGDKAATYAERYELRYRNGHVLAPGDYPVGRALRGEVLKDVVVEVGRRGEAPSWVHKVDSLQLHDGGGKPDFLVLILDDVTEEFEAEERFEQVFAANPAPAIICRLADSRFIKVNRGFLEMTGYHREGVIGRSIYEIDVLERAERREKAIHHFQAGATIGQMEAELSLPGGGSKLVIVAGHPIEVGKQPCMLFTFIDLEHRRKTEIALRQSEERFAQAFQLSPVPLLVTTLAERRILDVNQAFFAEFGHERSGVIGRTKVDLKLWGDTETRAAVERQLYETGRVRTTEVRLHRNTGEAVDCLLTSEGVTILGERCVLTVIQNITAQRRSDARLQQAVEAVMQDTSWLGQKIVAKINSYADPDGPSGEDTKNLSKRERQVLALIAQGAADKAIACTLKLSTNTVKNHVRSIYRKTGVCKRGEAVVWGRQRGILNHVFERK